MSGRKLIVVAASVATLMSAAVVTAPLADAKPKVKPPAKVAKARVASASISAVTITWKNPKSKKFKATVVRVAAGSKAPKSVRAGRAVGTIGKKRHGVAIVRLAPGTVYTASLFSSDGKKHYSKPVAVHFRTAAKPKPKPAPKPKPKPKPTKGAVTGTVFGGTSATKLSGANIDLYSDESNSDVETTSGSKGEYSFKNVAPGRYFVCVYSSSKVASPAGYVSDCSDAVTVAAGVTTVKNVTLAKAAGFTGTVVGKGGEKLKGVNVQAYDEDGGDVGDSDPTGNDGTFVVTGLSESASQLCFSPDTNTGTAEYGYAGKCIDVGATAGQLTALPDVTLDEAGQISGTVLGAKSPTDIPLQNVDVYAIDASEEFSSGSSEQSDPDGNFAVSDLQAGSYYVCFDASSVDPDLTQVPLGYYSACKTATGLVSWNGDSGSVPDSAAKFTVTAGSSTPSTNATLQAAGAISGTVTSADGGDVTDASVSVYTSGKEYLRSVDIAESGTYEVDQLAPGTYFLCVAAQSGDPGGSGTGHLSECYNDKAWSGDDSDLPTGLTQIQVKASVSTPDQDVELAVAGAFSGKVTGGGRGVAFRAYVYNSAGEQIDTSRYDSPAANGSYTFGGLPAGTYHVCFASRDDDGVYGSQCYKNVKWSEDDDLPAGLTNVVVTTGSVAETGVDAVLPRA